MKKIFYLAIMASVFLAGCSPVIYTNSAPQPVYNDQQQASNDQPQISQEFYDQLSPYGNWIDYPDYGYVWQPNVDVNFRPYVTDGSWVYTDYGWTWASNFSWGWAPFHYGNWFYDDSYGWLWEPGQQWAPAWVTWGQSGDYYGWAPVPPRGYRGYGGSNWRPRDQDWNYVPARNIGQSNVNNYVVRNNTTVINNTTIINNVNTSNININRHNTMPLYNRGPKVSDVENIGHTKIQQVAVNVNSKPGRTTVNNNQLTVYQPAGRPNTALGNSKPAPQKVIAYRKGNNPNPNGNQNQQNQGQDKNPGLGKNRLETVQPNQQSPQAPRQGNGQGVNPNPALQQNQQAPRQANGQGVNPNTTLQQPQQPNKQFSGQGNSQNPNRQPNQQAIKQGNGQGVNPNPALQPGQQAPRQGNGQGGSQNPNQPVKKIMNQNPGLQPAKPQQQPARPPQQQQPRPPQQQPAKQPQPPVRSPQPQPKPPVPEPQPKKQPDPPVKQ